MTTLDINIGGESVTYDLVAKTATTNGVTRQCVGSELEVLESEIQVRAALNAAIATRNAVVDGDATAQATMRTVTDAIILWNQDATAYLFGPLGTDPADQTTFGKPLYGKFDVPKVSLLMQQAESAILAYKARPEKTSDLRDQYEWLIGRSSQANAIMNLASLAG